MFKVAIGMPVYNRDMYFEEALFFIKRQTFQDFTCLISDNASPHDHIHRIFKKVVGDDKRFSYVRQNTKLGVLENFDYVFQNTKSEYFMWAADDDVRHIDFLHHAVSKLDQDSRYSAWFCNIEGISAHGKIYREFDNMSRLSSSRRKNLDLLKFLFEPEILGKANLFYSIFRRPQLADIWSRFDSEQFGTWGADMAMTYGFLSRNNIYIDPRTLFQKREGGLTEGMKILDPRLSIYPAAEAKAYFDNYVRVAANPIFTRCALELRRCYDTFYLGLARIRKSQGVASFPLENAPDKSF